MKGMNASAISISRVHEKRPRTIAEAEAELTRLKQIEADLIDELEALIAKLKEAEEGVGDKILDARLSGGGEDAINMEINNIWLNVDTVRRARKSATRARILAERNIILARAGEMRAEAADLRREAEKRLEKTNDLLQQLLEHEGAKFVAYPPIHPSGVGFMVDVPPTKSAEILMNARAFEGDAQRLQQEAGRIERRAHAGYAATSASEQE